MTMEFLKLIRSRGLSISIANSGKLHIDASPETIPKDIKTLIIKNKSQILKILRLEIETDNYFSQASQKVAEVYPNDFWQWFGRKSDLIVKQQNLLDDINKTWNAVLDGRETLGNFKIAVDVWLKFWITIISTKGK